MSEPRLLRVLAKEDGVSVADLTEAANPVVVFVDNAMSGLLLLVRDVYAEMGIDSSKKSPAVGRLLDALRPALDQYRVTRNKFFGGVSNHVDTANQIRVIEALFKQLEECHRPK